MQAYFLVVLFASPQRLALFVRSVSSFVISRDIRWLLAHERAGAARGDALPTVCYRLHACERVSLEA
jgi:hypothetical protein